MQPEGKAMTGKLGIPWAEVRLFTATAVSFLPVPVACVVWWLDVWIGISAAPLFGVILIGAGLVAAAIAYALGRYQGFLVAPLAFCLFVLVLQHWERNPMKPAVRIENEIREGMTEAEVRTLIAKHFPEEGRFRRPVIRVDGPFWLDKYFGRYDHRLSFIVDVHDGRYDAAILSAYFKDGRCISTDFSPD